LPGNSTAIRTLALVGAGALITWLALDRGGDPRIQIARYLKSGAIGALIPQEQTRLKVILRFLEQRVALSKHLALNGPPDAARLHVYVTTPEAEETTGCGPGNAVYDARLDVIFLDRSLVRVDLLEPSRQSVWSETLGFQDAYLALILLHELGHRQLHGRTSGAYDQPGRATGATLQRELEADRFALAAFKAASPAEVLPLFGPEHIQPMMWMNIDPQSIPADENALCNLAASIRLMTDIAFAWDSPFSTLYQTSSHPLLVDRTLRVVDVALGEVRGGIVQRQFEIAREDALRFRSVIGRDIRRVRAQRNIAVSVVTRDSVIIVDQAGVPYRLSLLNTGKVEERLTPLMGPFTSGPDGAHPVGVWADASAGFVVLDRNGGLWKAAGPAWQKAFDFEAAAGARSVTVSDSDVYRSPDGERAVILGRGPDVSFVALFNGAALVAKRNLSELQTDTARIAGVTGADVRLNSLGHNAVYAEVYRGSELIGIVEVMAETLKPAVFHPLSWHRVGLKWSRFDKVLVVGASEKPQFLGLSTYVQDPDHGFVHGCFLYRLRSTAPPEALLSDPNIFVDFTPENAGFVKASNREPHFDIDDARVSGSWILCFAVDSDSVYSIDLEKPNPGIRRIFHPGRMTITASSSRNIFLFSQKGARAGFVTQVE
jgi:hypothetical protein